MSQSIHSNFVFLNLEPMVKSAKAKLPKAFRTLFSEKNDLVERRKAFFALLESIETDWMMAMPSASGINNRRRATLAFYALVGGSSKEAMADTEVEKMIRWLLPTKVGPGKAVADAAGRFAAA